MLQIGGKIEMRIGSAPTHGFLWIYWSIFDLLKLCEFPYCACNDAVVRHGTHEFCARHNIRNNIWSIILRILWNVMPVLIIIFTTGEHTRRVLRNKQMLSWHAPRIMSNLPWNCSLDNNLNKIYVPVRARSYCHFCIYYITPSAYHQHLLHGMHHVFHW